MNILLAVCAMANRSGAEWYVSDMARALSKLGHRIQVYAPIMGDMADELRSQSIACASNLEKIARAPDVIVGNTRDETVACLAQFPGVPALSICHDRVHVHGMPARFSRIRRFTAVDLNCAERLFLEHGIPEQEVALVPNGVDLNRFHRRGPLPPKPGKALLFSNYATESNETAAVRAACEQLGVLLDIAGSGTGQQVKNPEQQLGEYDVVFAKARCAFEAMATGCAVILLNEGMGMAGLVKTDNVEEWMGWNFGRRLLNEPINQQALETALNQFSSTDAHSVCDYIREHASLTTSAKILESLLVEVLANDKRKGSVPLEVEHREFSRHLLDNLQPFGTVPVAVQVGRLDEQVVDRDRRLVRLSRQLQKQTAKIEDLSAQLQKKDRQIAELVQKLRDTKGEPWPRCS